MADFSDKKKSLIYIENEIKTWKFSFKFLSVIRAAGKVVRAQIQNTPVGTSYLKCTKTLFCE